MAQGDNKDLQQEQDGRGQKDSRYGCLQALQQSLLLLCDEAE